MLKKQKKRLPHPDKSGFAMTYGKVKKKDCAMLKIIDLSFKI